MINTRKQRIVKSPYWPSNGFVNPNFPTGCSKSTNKFLHQKSITLVHRVDATAVTLSSGKVLHIKNREALKKLKKECVNKGSMTTIFSNTLS